MRILDILVQGALLGGLYALYAAGLSLIFGVMRLVNLAHGDFIVLAAYMLLALASGLGLPLPYALLIAAPFLFALGYGLQRLLFERVLGDDILAPLLVSFGLSIMIQNGLLELFSADSRKLSLGAIEGASIGILPGLAVGVVPLATFTAAILAILGLSWLFYGTSAGRLLRATADSTEIVQLMGVNPRRVFAVAMGLSLAVIALAAFFMGLRASFDPSMGPASLRVRGGGDRRAGQPVGHAGGRHRARHRADRRRRDQPGMADPRGPPCLPDCPPRPTARSLRQGRMT
jgi:branched-chain amino acid transport system permease protein